MAGLFLAITFGSILSYLPKVPANAITITMPDIDWIMGETATVMDLTNTNSYLSDFGTDTVFLALALQGAPSDARLSIPLSGTQSAPIGATTTRVIRLSGTESVTAGFGYCNNTGNNGQTVNGTAITCNTTNSLNGFTAFSMRGSQANINTLLGQLRYTRTSTSGDQRAPSVVIAAMVDVPGVTYYFDGLDDHYYRVGHYPSGSSGSIPAETASDIGYYCRSNDAANNGQTVVDDTTYQNALATEGLVVRAKAKRGTGAANTEGNCSWNEADRLARESRFKGQRGYLANITTQEENDLLQNNLAGARNVWIGGTDGACDGSHTNVVLNDFNRTSDTSSATACSAASNRTDGGTEGVFRYYDGPESNTVFWRYTTASGSANPGGTYEKNGYGGRTNTGGRLTGQFARFKNEAVGSGEPNNSSSSFISSSPSGRFRANDPETNVNASVQGEDNIVFNWEANDGFWNDLHQREPSVSFYGFIIEYGGAGFSDFDGILRENKPILFTTPERRIPNVIPVDPQSNQVYLPMSLLVRGIPNVRVCFNQWSSDTTTATASTNPIIAFDVSTQGSSNNTTTGTPRISGDRTTELAIWWDSATVFNTINSSLGVNAYLTNSTTFNDSYFVRVRVVPIANNNPTVSCRGASVGGSRTIELRPFEKERTFMKPRVDLTRNNQ